MSNNFKEKLIIKFKQNWIRNNVMTILLIAILVTVFIALNLWVQSVDLAQIDVTENKIYSLTDDSKEMLKNINKEVKIYLWEYVEDSSVVDLIKQYCHENNNIKYEILTEENNKEKVEKAHDGDIKFNLPIIVFSALCLIFGIFSSGLIEVVSSLVSL